MLILTRRVNESIKVGDDIDIRIVGMERGQVKIAITAPANVAIHREEIYNKVGSSSFAANRASRIVADKSLSQEEITRHIADYLKSP